MRPVHIKMEGKEILNKTKSKKKKNEKNKLISDDLIAKKRNCF